MDKTGTLNSMCKDSAMTTTADVGCNNETEVLHHICLDYIQRGLGTEFHVFGKSC